MNKFKVGDLVDVDDFGVSGNYAGQGEVVGFEYGWPIVRPIYPLGLNGWNCPFPFSPRRVTPINPKSTESVTAEADRLVSTDRGNSYGHPLDDFGKVTGMALALWGRGPQTEEEHAIYMMLVKISREANKHKRDNLVDVCGYAKTLEMVVEERKRRGTDDA